jgi:hypothetical protein
MENNVLPIKCNSYTLDELKYDILFIEWEGRV